MLSILEENGKKQTKLFYKMRILIVAVARSGSTVLTHWVGKELGYPIYSEPNRMQNTDGIDGNRLVVKLVWNDIKREGIQINQIDWDKIIRLSRRDVRESGESFARAIERNEWKDQYAITHNWISRNESTIRHWQTVLENNKIEMLSQNWKGICVEYESIYENKTDIERICEYIGITNPKHLDILDNKNRYRKPYKLI